MTKQSRVIVITGGGSGMGRAAALKFAKAGDNVYILGRTHEKLEKTAAEHKSITAIVCDVTDQVAIEAAITEITKTHTSIDVLVNNAGGSAKTKYDDPTPEQAKAMWDEIIATNLTSVFLVTSAFIPHLAKNEGRVINVTSLAGLNGSKQGGVTGLAYSAAKEAVHGMSRTLVYALAPEGITVNCIAPGLIDNTNFFPNGHPPDRVKDAYLPVIPLGQVGEPEDIAAGIFFLASKEASYITGEILNINGGALFGR